MKTRERRKLGLLAAALGLQLLLTSPYVAADNKAEEKLKTAYSLFKSGMSSADTVKLTKVFAKDYTITSWQGGSLNGEMLLQMLKTGQIKIKSARISEESFRFFHDTMLVTGRMKNKVFLQGTPLDEDMRFTSLYAISGDKAELVHTQTTLVAPAPTGSTHQNK